MAGVSHLCPAALPLQAYEIHALVRLGRARGDAHRLRIVLDFGRGSEPRRDGSPEWIHLFAEGLHVPLMLRRRKRLGATTRTGRFTWRLPAFIEEQRSAWHAAWAMRRSA